MTNYEKIKAMTIDEMLKLFIEIYNRGWIDGCRGWIDAYNDDDTLNIYDKNWLESEEEE